MKYNYVRVWESDEDVESTDVKELLWPSVQYRVRQLGFCFPAQFRRARLSKARLSDEMLNGWPAPKDLKRRVRMLIL